MAKINIKLDKQFLSELTGSLNKSFLDGNKKLLSLFDLINNHKKDNTIDIKEITDFANSIFTADTNKDGEVDKTELETYVKNNENKFKELKIKAKDILEFLNNFRINADKTDTKNQRITNDDESYSIVYEELETDDTRHIPKEYQSVFKKDDKVIKKQINYDKENNIITIETTEGNQKIIKDKDGKVLTTQQLKENVVVSEKKADGLTYYYDGNKTIIKNRFGKTIKEIEVLENDKKIIKDYQKIDSGKTVLTITNEETGEKTQETLYDDSYYVHVREGSVIALRDIKKIFNQPISSDTYHSINYMGKDIIKMLAKEDDKNFQKTYITGMVNKIIELAELIGENPSEVKAIKKEIETKGFDNVSIDKINQAYSKLFEKIEKSNPEFETSKISNKYYTSKYSYTKITMNNKIVIMNSENNKTVIDKNNLLRVYSQHDKNVIWDVIKDFPAEALVDMAVEVTFSNERVSEGVAAAFNYVFDKIIIGEVVSAEDILHEMGHAIDCKGKGNNSHQTMHNAKFKQAFKDDMDAFLKGGNKRYILKYDTNNDRYTGKNEVFSEAKSDNDSNYATLSEQEMFAECYALIMLGHCQSEEVINKYFQNTKNCVIEMVENTRKLPKSQRH